MRIKTKKICILSSVHQAFDVRIFHKEAKSLVLAGYDVTLIIQHSKNEIIDGVKIIALSKPKNRFLRIFGTTWKVFRLALKQKSNVYHFHDPELIPIGILLKIFTTGKVIYDVHEELYKDIICKKWISTFLRKPLAWFLKNMEKIFSKKFDYIFAAYESIARGFAKQNNIVINNYPLVTIFSQIQKESKKQNNNYILIYVGGMSPLKGINEMVMAMDLIEYSNVKLRLIGKFDDKIFEKYIKNLKGFSKVEYLGFKSQEETWRYLINANVGIACFHPVHKECLPNKLFEYMAAGLPVIVSNFSLWKKIIEENKCGITVDPLNPKKIAKAFEFSTKHPIEAKKMGENGRKATLKKYNWEKEAKKMIKIYKSI